MASGSKAVIYAALAGNAMISITKFGASVYTGSSAMLTEALHSLIDTGNQMLLLWGLKKAKQPPSDQFPFGHGKEIYFWSFVVAIMIFAIGAGVSVYEGAKHIVHALEHPGQGALKDPTVNYIVLGLALLFEGSAWFFAWRSFKAYKGDMGYFEAVRNGKDPTMFIVLFEDSAAMLGLLVAFIGITLGQITQNPIFDGIASVLIGVILGGVAALLAVETKGLLIGESASSTVREGIRALVTQHENVISVNELLTMHMGPENILVTMSLDLKDDIRSQDIEAEISSINREVRRAFPDVKRIFIEVESFLAHKAQVDLANKPVDFDEHDDDHEHSLEGSRG